MSAKSSGALSILVEPFQRFFRIEASSGILLILAAVIALTWANSPFSDIYNSLIDRELSVQFGSIFKLSKPLLLWINDGLMAVFFFVVGLEIKREILVGELSSFRQAALPICAAIGGMVVPVVLFAALQGNNPGIEGWGIPMATDIAFSLGILSLLGKRVPLSIKIFLAAFAIVDDIGAVLVIAVFYSDQVYWQMLFIALALFGLLALSVRVGMRNWGVFLIVSIFIWYYFLKSGLHPTIAGVMLAFIVPAKRKIKTAVFNRIMKINLQPFQESNSEEKLLLTREQTAALDNIEDYLDHVHSPLQNIEHKMHGFVSYLIMPLFALANAGVLLSSSGGGQVISLLSLNIALGLILGKLVGVLLFSWIGVRLKIASLPESANWGQIAGLGLLGGVGFTMSLFISGLAFQDAGLMNQSKIGILIGSLIAGVAGYFVLRFTLKKRV